MSNEDKVHFPQSGRSHQDGQQRTGLGPKCVENLCILIGTTGAFIVLTADMKESSSGTPMPFGDRVVGFIPQLDGRTRSEGGLLPSLKSTPARNTSFSTPRNSGYVDGAKL